MANAILEEKGFRTLRLYGDAVVTGKVENLPEKGKRSLLVYTMDQAPATTDRGLIGRSMINTGQARDSTSAPEDLTATPECA